MEQNDKKIKFINIMKIIIIIIFIIFSFITISIFPYQESSTVQLESDYIIVICDEKGNFALKTSSKIDENVAKKNETIIYKSEKIPHPALIKIGEASYYFGDEDGRITTETKKIDENMIITGWEISSEKIKLTQFLTLENGHNGNKDKLRIKYMVENKSDITRDISLKFVIGLEPNKYKEIKYEYYDEQYAITLPINLNQKLTTIPKYLIAYDNAESSSVKVMGSFNYADEIIITKRERLNQNKWDFTVEDTGNSSSDTAIGIFFNERQIRKNNYDFFHIDYGLYNELPEKEVLSDEQISEFKKTDKKTDELNELYSEFEQLYEKISLYLEKKDYINLKKIKESEEYKTIINRLNNETETDDTNSETTEENQ